MNSTYRIMLLLVLFGSATNVFAQGLSISDVNGSPTYIYPIHTQSINGVELNLDFRWVGNITQTHLAEYQQDLDTLGLPVSKWYWKKRQRQHGMWVFSVNGICLQTLQQPHSFEFDYIGATPSDYEVDDLEISWLTEGYDYSNSIDWIFRTN